MRHGSTQTCVQVLKYKILIRIQSRITHKVLFHDKVLVWCIISARKIIELIFFFKNSKFRTIHLQITALFFYSSDEGKEYKFFQQCGATAHTRNNLMATLYNISGE